MSDAIFPSRLRGLRELAQLDQGQLAALTGIPVSEIADIENGTVPLTADHAWVIAIWLEVPVTSLLEWGALQSERTHDNLNSRPRRAERC